MTAKKSNAEKILNKGLTFINKGWTKGVDWVDADGSPVYNWREAKSMCLQGAVKAARLSLKLKHRDETKAREFLNQATPKGYGFVSYNDAKRRTKEQVKALIVAAAGLARKAAKVKTKKAA